MIEPTQGDVPSNVGHTTISGTDVHTDDSLDQQGRNDHVVDQLRVFQQEQSKS